MIKRLLSILFVSCALTTGAFAATTSYTSFETFVDDVTAPLEIEDFTSSVTGTSLLTNQDFGAFSAIANSTVDTVRGTQFNYIGNRGANRRGMTGNNLQVGLREGETFKIVFDRPIIAFGADFANVNDASPNNGRYKGIRSSFSGGGTTDWLEAVVGGSARFFGIFATESFTEITITGLRETEGFGIDNMRWAYAPPPPTPVPLPASGVLLAGAVLAAGVFGRRKARA